MFLSDKMKGINSFDYIEKYNEVTKEYTETVLKNVFKKRNMVMSVIKEKNKKYCRKMSKKGIRKLA